jgi:hypothetical protein
MMVVAGDHDPNLPGMKEIGVRAFANFLRGRASAGGCDR